MPEIDNCPVCNTTCELEFGLEQTVGTDLVQKCATPPARPVRPDGEEEKIPEY